MAKIATWNINSVRLRIAHILDFLKHEDPDILLLQELKCKNINFPYESLSHKYNIRISGQKSYNGVAILSKFTIDEIKTTFPNNPCPDQARFIEISCNMDIGYSRIISVYCPNGSEIGSDKFTSKMAFFDHLTKYLEGADNMDENIIVGGDFNIAPFDIDVYSSKDLENSIGYSLEERQKMRKILNVGYYDLYRIHNPTAQEYSWWDYRSQSFSKNLGMRIDTIIGNSIAADKLCNTYIAKSYRGKEKPSDHAPVISEFKRSIF